MKKRKNESGFAPLEMLLLAVIVAILVFTGWYVHRSITSANKNLSSAQNTNLANSKKKTTNKLNKLPGVPTGTTATVPTVNDPTTSQSVADNGPNSPGLGDFDSGIQLTGTITGHIASLSWKWGKNMDPSKGFRIDYVTGGTKFDSSSAKHASIVPYTYSTYLDISPNGHYYVEVCQADKQPNDATCSKALNLTAS
jgi:cytoskeletal protein RodZ